MGLTGTHSWNANSNDSTVQRYQSNGNTKGAFQYFGAWRFIMAYNNGNQLTNHVIFTIKTDAAGCSTLQFSCDGERRGTSGPPKLYWKIQTSKSLDTSGMTEASYSSLTWSGTISSTKMLPNTIYYIHFYSNFGSDPDHSNSLHGTMTITGSGTYGSPGEITANNTTFDSAITMSYASATSGGTYTVKVKVGTSAEVTLQTQSSTSSRSWTPSLATYGSSYPNQSSVSCVITVMTYFSGTLSGTKTKTVTISFTAAQVAPTTSSAFSIAPYNTGQVAGKTGYIRGYSKIRATFTAANVTKKYGASVAKWSVKFGSAAAVDVAAGTTTKDSGVISAVTTVTCTVTDSRGFTASETYTTTITPYENPALTATIKRTDSSGNEDDAGTYLRIDLAGWYSDIDGQNTQTSVVRRKLASAGSYDAAIAINTGSTTQSGTRKLYSVSNFLVSGMTDAVYNVEVEITDGLGNKAVASAVIESQHWAIHFRNKGTGAAMGKAAERDSELDIGSWKLTCGDVVLNGTSLKSLLNL